MAPEPFEVDGTKIAPTPSTSKYSIYGFEVGSSGLIIEQVATAQLAWRHKVLADLEVPEGEGFGINIEGI